MNTARTEEEALPESRALGSEAVRIGGHFKLVLPHKLQPQLLLALLVHVLLPQIALDLQLSLDITFSYRPLASVLF